MSEPENEVVQDVSGLAQQYQRKTDKQHILDNPDTYIGSVENVDADMWVYDEETKRIVLKTIEYIPGLYKLFDEGIVNARDHVIRMIHSSAEDKKYVTFIDTAIEEDGTITITNDGNGIDVAKHPEYDVWIPELVFGHLRTSTNYNKNEERIVGGKNGFGFKLVLIWSTYGRIETVDHVRGLKYVQEFKTNLDEICPPKITSCKGAKPYTKVSFKPDYARLKIQGLTFDMLALLRKRIYDIGAVTDHSAKKVKIGYNGETIPVKNFQQYIDMYIGDKSTTKRVYEIDEKNNRWEYAVAISPTHEFIAISFVNGICTFKGGKHVDYIRGQITRKIAAYIEKKKKIVVNENAIKEQLILFLRCDIVNPSFDSQTKDYMNTPSSKFGSTCTVSEGFIEKVAKMGVMDLACSLTEAKENRLAKKTDGQKTKTIRGIANFVDANDAGTPKSKDCILILCEGLSALSGIVSGLSSADRNTIGIYPLKGKLLNVRGEQIKRVNENKEITDLKKIIGLESGRIYESMADIHKQLRYGKIMFVTDQDLDGSHIKGLCINVFHSEWASLFKIPGFLSFMNTPILRAKKGTQTRLFYNDGEYQAWKDSLVPNGTEAQIRHALKSWTIKYFKGLGTSTSAEFKEYFANKKIVDFVYTGPDSDNSIDMVFNKKRADDRKTWLEDYNKTLYLDTNRPSVQYQEFINQELIHFSTYDCDRSIPNMVDGLKTSLRKILFSAFKRRLTQEIKVAQFSGYVSEHSSYHHGEASLNGAIVNMAQNFVGSNNIHLLEPLGQFGTRLQGGDDSASERYIFTQLSGITRALFPEADDAILTYLDDDGTSVEPEYYVPILPFALINGISGIGTGFSCSIPAYNPATIVTYLRNWLSGKDNSTTEFLPYYEGFTGSVKKIDDHKYLIKGVYEKTGPDTVRIQELPVGTWTMPYITFLESLMDGNTVDKKGKKIPPSIKDFTSISTEVKVDITIVFPKGRIAELEASVDKQGVNGLEKLLKLTTTESSTNMHMFNADHKLRKYGSVEDLIGDFSTIRMETYKKRKEYLMKELEDRLVKLSNRAQFILNNLDGTIDLRKKTALQVHEILKSKKFAEIDGDYKYLVKMPMDSVTEENVMHILQEKDNAYQELKKLTETTLQQMWLAELDHFEKEYARYKDRRREIQFGIPAAKSGKVVIKKTGRKVVIKK